MSAVEPLAVSRMTGDRAALAQLAHDLDAVEVGHDDVEQDDVRPDLLGLLERLFAAVGGDDAEALFAEGDRDELRDPGLVVGDEHEWLGAHRSPPGLVTVDRCALAHDACGWTGQDRRGSDAD